MVTCASEVTTEEEDNDGEVISEIAAVSDECGSTGFTEIIKFWKENETIKLVKSVGKTFNYPNETIVFCSIVKISLFFPMNIKDQRTIILKLSKQCSMIT